MDLDRDTILALQRHFIGALRAPVRASVEPLSPARLAFAGHAVARGGVLDLGVVSSPGEERSTVRVCYPGAERVEVRLGDAPQWLEARWASASGPTVSLDGGAAGVVLEMVVVHDDERDFRGSVVFEVICGERRMRDELAVRMVARRSHPMALFDFNGSPFPTGFDFGAGEASYRLSVANRASVPLVVSFSDLPAWLRFEVDGCDRGGPAMGRFFERAAPFTATIRAFGTEAVSGRQRAALRLETNDPRPELRTIQLPFAASFKRRKQTAAKRLDRTPRGPIILPATVVVIAAVFAFALLTYLFLAMRGLS